MLRKASIVSLFLLGLITSCKKNSANPNEIPNVAVNFGPYSIYEPGYNNLQTIGSGWVYVINTGYNNNGIILFRNSATTILAFDRSCPYDCQTNTKAIVNIQTGAITTICPVCGTQYSLYIGTVSNKGPGGIALKQYTVNFDGTNFTVSN